MSKKMTTSLSEKRIKIVEEVISNDDLLLQVLLCLPARPLIRFKCVSKHWFSLISDPKFCSKYTRLNHVSPTMGIYFFYENWSGLKSVSLNQVNQNDIPALKEIKNTFLEFDLDMPKIMHACNGLFLCSYGSKRPYLVSNFTTQTYIILPQHPLPAYGTFRNDHSAYLVYDPSKTQHFKVVLLDVAMCRHDMILHHEDEYKAKAGYCSGRGGCYEIDVYSSETKVWKRVYFRAPRDLHHISYKAVCNGSLHWITFDKSHFQFDVDKTELKFNPLPEKPKTLDLRKVRYFGESCGRLFFICILWRNDKLFNVFELDRDHSSWKTKYRVNLSPLMDSFPGSFQRPERNGTVIKSWNFSVLCVVKEDEMNGFAILLSMPGKIVSYNLNTNKFRVMKDLTMQEYPPLDSSYNFAYTFPFMANLSLL